MSPYTSDEEILEELARHKWGSTGFSCDCGCTECRRIAGRIRIRVCRRCGKHVSITAGTLLAGCRVPLIAFKEVLESMIAHKRIPTCTELAATYQIARSSAWWLVQKALRAVALLPANDRLLTEILQIGVRKPKRKPLTTHAPAHVRRIHEAHRLGLIRKARVGVEFHFGRVRVSVGEVGVRPSDEQPQSAGLCTAPPTRGSFGHWLGIHLFLVRRGVSLRWLPRWLGGIVPGWNHRDQPDDPRTWLEPAVDAGGRIQAALDPWLPVR